MTKAEDLWNNCLVFIKDNVPSQIFKTWFLPIKAVSLQKKTLKIEVPSKFFFEWIEEHYVKLLKVALRKELGEGIKLVYAIKMENTYGNKKPFIETIPSSNISKISPQEIKPMTKHELKREEFQNPFVIPGLQKIKVESQLNPNFSFEHFVEGDSNRLARSTGLAVANKPGFTSFNPLFIFGNVGLGKTHLANAIGVEIKEKYPEKVVLYITTDKFTQQHVEAVRKNTRNDFIHYYQHLDVIIMDDIELLAGKIGTQNVFFHIYNHLHQNGKQIILTSDKPPVELHDIEKRLLSRFKWGLSAQIQAPSLEMRMEILKNRLYRDGLVVEENVLEYIAKNVKTSIRELEGVVISLVAHSFYDKKNIDLELAKKTVNHFVRESYKEITIDRIKKTVSNYFKIDVSELTSSSRKRQFTQARQIAMYFSKKKTNNSLQNIGSQLGRKNHATVLYAYKTIENLLTIDKQMQGHIKDLNRELSE